TAIRAGGIDVAIWIGGVGGKLLRRRGKRAAQHWFVNEVDPELEGVGSHHVAQVVAELVFVLIAQVGEKSDGSGELIVAEGLKAGDGQRGHAEGKLYGEAEIRIPRLREMQQAGVENQVAQPG